MRLNGWARELVAPCCGHGYTSARVLRKKSGIPQPDPTMPTFTFEYCALYHLNWWLLRDRKYYEAFEGDDETTQRQALMDAATHYRVARNLRLGSDANIGLMKAIRLWITKLGSRRPRLEPVSTSKKFCRHITERRLQIIFRNGADIYGSHRYGWS
jgi:hypothetical protein